MRYIEILSYIRSRVILLLMVTILSIYINISVLIETAPEAANLSILDTISMQLGGGSISAITLTFPIIPLFCFLILNIISYDDSNQVITRTTKRKDLWIRQVKLVTIISIIYSVIIVGISYIIGGTILGNFTNRWTEDSGYIFEVLSNQANWMEIKRFLTTPVILIFILLSLILGLILIGIITLILKLKLKSIFAFFTVIAIVLLDILIDNFSYILKNMYISIENLMYPKSIVFQEVFMLIGIIFLYKIGKSLVENKDFI